MVEDSLEDIEGKKREIQAQADKLEEKDTEIAKRESDVSVLQKQLDKKNAAFKEQVHKLTKREAEIKVEEAKIEALKKELAAGPVPAGGGMDATIILQQKQILEQCLSQNEKTEHLLARQLKLEEERAVRVKERDKKEEESLATGKGFKPPSFKGVEGQRPEAHILRAEDWMEASNTLMKDEQKVKNFRLTLDHHAREWYDKADCKGSWKKCETRIQQVLLYTRKINEESPY